MNGASPARRTLARLALVSVLLVGILVTNSPRAEAIPLDFGNVDVATSADNARSAVSADLDGDGDLDLASASQSDDTIAWYENTVGNGSSWAATEVATTAEGAISITAGDLDGDGDLDLASASLFDDTVAWYENTVGDGSTWIAMNVATTADAASSVIAGDLDGDGDLDLASASVSDDTLAWYENTAGDGSAWTAVDAVINDGVWSVTTGDIDGDGDLDLASTSLNDDTIAWHPNDLTARSQPAWVATDVATSAFIPQSVTTGDFDGDGDVDLASASQGDDTIAWYENTGDGSAWTATDIATNADGARAVIAGDLDGDGDLDLASASQDDGTIAWYENTSGDGSAWASTDIITTAIGALTVTTGDLDGDGDLDLASGSFINGTIVWYENIDGDGSDWISAVVVDRPAGVVSVTTGDLDGDGDLDLVSGNFNDVTAAWYENTSGDGSAWAAANVTTNLSATFSVTVGDLDGDGDLDLASASSNDGTVAWFENTLGDGTAWAETDITSTANGAWSVTTGDLDGDGELDLASANAYSSSIAWYEVLPSLSVDDVSASEGGDLTFTITTGRLNQAASVDVTTTSGTATDGSDYTTLTDEPVTIGAGQTSNTVTVTSAQDTIFEVDEDFTLSLVTPTEAGISDGSATGTILDDDSMPEISIGDVSLAEGDSGATAMNFGVTLTNPSGTDITVSYDTLDDTAIAPDDYIAADDDLVIPAGATSGTIAISVVGDNTVEPDETFFVDLSSPVGATTLDDRGVGTILNDDAPTPPPPDPPPTDPPPIDGCEPDEDDICGSDGDDSLTIGPSADADGDGRVEVHLGDGNDSLCIQNGLGFVVTVLGGPGDDDVVVGDCGFDPGSAEPTTLIFEGKAGNDRAQAAGGDDVLRGGSGNDNLSAGRGADLISGERGLDTLRGGAGHDRLRGGSARDSLDGGEGRDQCVDGATTTTFRSCEVRT